MPRLTKSVPQYRKHRASGQAVVTIDGRDHYLGPFGSKASRIEYDRLIGEWQANGRIQWIRRIFRWAVSEEMIPPAVLQGLETVEGFPRFGLPELPRTRFRAFNRWKRAGSEPFDAGPEIRSLS